MPKVDFDSLEIVDDIVSFNEDDHEYVSELDGAQYMSVTTLLKYYNLSYSDYDNVPPSILKAKAAYGSAVHKALENFINGDDTQLLIPEVSAFNDWLMQNNLERYDCKSEQKVYNRNYMIAGTVDLQAWNIIADFKTTSVLNTLSVMWQLSLYNYLLHPDESEYTLYELKCFWFDNNGNLTVKDIPLVNYNKLIDMLEAYKRGDIIWVDNTVPTLLVDKVDELIKQRKLIDAVNKNLKALENEEEVLKELIKEEMANQNLIYVQGNTGVVTITETSRSTFDNHKIEELLRQLKLDKKDYIKTSTSVRMNVKELNKVKP